MANPGGFLKKVIADKPLGPEKAIFAVREVVQRDIPICKSRGMACVIEVGGRKRLLTWHGVINENDQAKPIKLHRSSHELEMSKIKENGGCSFISVKGRDDAFTGKCSILYLQVPESKEKIKDVVAYSFIGCKDIVKFTFKYSQQSRKHELRSSDKKGCFFEKSAILGSPIITDKGRVIGVVGEDSNGQFCPNFLTETEFNHEEKDATEGGTCEVKDKDSGCALDAPDAFDKKENDPSEGGTSEIKVKEYEDSGYALATPDATGPIGPSNENLEKLTNAIIERKSNPPVPTSDQTARKNQEEGLRKFVTGREKSSSSTETVSTFESTGKSAIGQTTNNLKPLKSIISDKNKGGLEELKNAASEMGFTVSNNDGGGNCLFHALAEQLEIVTGIPIKHEELRKTLVGYLAGNPKLEDGTDLFSLLNMDQQSRFGTWETYLKHMERDGIWGDEMMIHAAANHYKTIINVLSFPGSRLVIPILPQCKVWLGHICDCHFVSLLKAPVSQSQQSINETQKEEHQELRDKQGELTSTADHVVHPTIYQTQEELTKDRGQLTMCEERPQHKQTSLSGLNSTKKSANWSSPQKNQIYPAAYKVNDSDTEPSEEIVRIGKFDQKDLPYLALDMLVTGKWRNIAVDLDVPVDELNCIDNSDEYEKCYKMWKTWIERNGDAASYKKLAEVLKDHELQIIRENYCLEGNHPPLQETVATSTSENVKQEKILDKDFMKIAKKIQGKRYRLGRVLGVGDSVLEQITAKDPGDILEQSYQILKKWHSTKGKCATFTALAKALRDRTVALKEVVEEFCLVK